MAEAVNGRRKPPQEARPPAPFIVGMGRSGSTLLRLMLDANSQLAIPPETYFFAPPDNGPFTGESADEAAQAMVESRFWADFGIPADVFLAEVGGRAASTSSDAIRIFYELYAAWRGKARWGDKTPVHVLMMTEIQRLLPEAHFVHLIRDGRDVALSAAPLWSGADKLEAVAREWSRRLVSARAQRSQLKFYMEVHFEKLIREPEETLKALCRFLEIEWEPSMLDYHRDAADRMAAETPDLKLADRVVSHAQRNEMQKLVSSPPVEERCEGWRRRMTAADVDRFAQVAGATLRAFGYSET